MAEIIETKLIRKNHDNPLARHLDIDKTRELIVSKYY